VQGRPAGGEGVAANTAGVRVVRGGSWYWGENERGVAAGPGGASMEASTWPHDQSLSSRVLRGEEERRGTRRVLPRASRNEQTASVESTGHGSSKGSMGNIFKLLPPLSCGLIFDSSVVVIDESESDQGQVLLIGGCDEGAPSTAVHKVDLATGECTAQASLLCPQGHLIFDSMAGRLPDGRIVCAGTTQSNTDTFTDEESFFTDEEEEPEWYATAQVLEPFPHGSLIDASWQWRALPGGSIEHIGGSGCVLSDGRFAVFGGMDFHGISIMSCEALTLDAEGARWDVLPPMHERRRSFACAAIGGCVVIAGGTGSITVDVSEKGLRRWRRFPCSLPHDGQLFRMGSALI